MKTILTQKHFTNEKNEVIGYVAVHLRCGYCDIPLTIDKELKKHFNTEARKLGFAVGKVEEIPTEKEVIL